MNQRDRIDFIAFCVMIAAVLMLVCEITGFLRP